MSHMCSCFFSQNIPWIFPWLDKPVWPMGYSQVYTVMYHCCGAGGGVSRKWMHTVSYRTSYDTLLHVFVHLLAFLSQKWWIFADNAHTPTGTRSLFTAPYVTCWPLCAQREPSQKEYPWSPSKWSYPRIFQILLRVLTVLRDTHASHNAYQQKSRTTRESPSSHLGDCYQA
jgi:hypothetical protein